MFATNQIFRFTFTFLLAFSSVIPGWSQTNPVEVYRSASYRSEALPKILTKISGRLERDLATLPKTHKSYLAKEYKERTDSLKSELLGGNFLMDTRWESWFQGIIDEILRNNPEIPKADITLLLSRYESANARSVGEGTLVFNVAMLPYLKNESQVAFILCHELAHYVNNHGNNALHQYINTLYSPETQKQLRAISKGKYNKTERALELMKSMAYNGRRHSRYKESEADSLGFVFMSRTKYSLSEAVTALQVLDELDHSNWPSIPYSEIFNSPNFPFQKTWLEQPALGGFSAQKPKESEEFNEDSLKTHPDCPKRIALTQTQLALLGERPEGKNFLQPESSFLQLQDWSQYEIVEGLYDRGEYGRALFRNLILLTQRPDDAYLNAMTVKCLYEICLYQRSHQLRQVLDLPSAGYSQEYNRYLKFVNQFRVSDLTRVTYHFYQDRWEKFQKEEDFAFAAILASDLADDSAAFKTRKQHYLSSFPKGKYLKQIEALDE
ncbi:MAG: M48 family metalloprotease [Saprospiraceae bacterium]|jgi:Zn-dependent protease with chaperone function|nr:M48 family metalloprotease [Saprospiraceae bacterium]